jgi:hypothetical protein
LEHYESQRGLPDVGLLMQLGQGLFHRGSTFFVAESAKPFPDGKPGYGGWNKNQLTHSLPGITYLNVNPITIDREIMGLDPHPQTGYFPKDLEGLNTVAELVTVLADWEPRATRKSELIQK